MIHRFLVLFQVNGAKKVVDIIILWETENLALPFSHFAPLADLWHLSTCLVYNQGPHEIQGACSPAQVCSGAHALPICEMNINGC